MKKVAIIMGSESDWPIMQEAQKALKELGIESEARVLSAHRTPREALAFAEKAHENGFGALIAGAGGAAHLPGVLAAMTLLPVIGVPIGSSPLQGQDALYAIVQMPKGIPVACVAINGAWNAGLLAGQILGATAPLQRLRDRMKEQVLSTRLT